MERIQPQVSKRIQKILEGYRKPRSRTLLNTKIDEKEIISNAKKLEELFLNEEKVRELLGPQSPISPLFSISDSEFDKLPVNEISNCVKNMLMKFYSKRKSKLVTKIEEKKDAMIEERKKARLEKINRLRDLSKPKRVVKKKVKEKVVKGHQTSKVDYGKKLGVPKLRYHVRVKSCELKTERIGITKKKKISRKRGHIRTKSVGCTPSATFDGNYNFERKCKTPKPKKKKKRKG